MILIYFIKKSQFSQINKSKFHHQMRTHHAKMRGPQNDDFTGKSQKDNPSG